MLRVITNQFSTVKSIMQTEPQLLTQALKHSEMIRAYAVLAAHSPSSKLGDFTQEIFGDCHQISHVTLDIMLVVHASLVPSTKLEVLVSFGLANPRYPNPPGLHSALPVV